MLVGYNLLRPSKEKDGLESIFALGTANFINNVSSKLQLKESTV